MSSSGYVAVTDFDWFSFLQGRQPLEEVIEEHIESHWDETPFARSGVGLARREVHGWPCRQVFAPVNAIDLLGFEAAAKRWWVLELKRGRSADAVVGRVSRYLGWIAEERGLQRRGISPSPKVTRGVPPRSSEQRVRVPLGDCEQLQGGV